MKKYKNVAEGWCGCAVPKDFSSWNRVTWIPANYGYRVCINCLGVYPRDQDFDDWKQEMKIRNIVQQELSKYFIEIRGVLRQ